MFAVHDATGSYCVRGVGRSPQSQGRQMSAGFIISASQIDGVFFARLVGELDAEHAPKLAQTLHEATGSVVVDCEALDGLDPDSVQVLVNLAERVPSLRLVNVSPSILEVLKRTGADRMLL